MNFEKAWLDHGIGIGTVKPVYNRIIISAEPDNFDERIIDNAAHELRDGIEAFCGTVPVITVRGESTDRPQENELLLKLVKPEGRPEGSYHINGGEKGLTISSDSETGILYGAFRYLFLLRTELNLGDIDVDEVPASPLRMLNHWDNPDGSIERGYSGNSFFFINNKLIVSERTRAYARLTASVGINASVINNVNVRGMASSLITGSCRTELKEMASLFASYGIKLYLCINFAAPIELGGLDSADPLEPAVAEWWKKTAKELFEDIPELGGFLIKADSEGRPGPFTYNRTHADGANMLADAVAPYGGLIIWRCFVYNCKQDWRDTVTDRARASYDNFKPLDGQFRENVILQVKNGPMDFQIREPVSPLLGGLSHTNEIVEFQNAQEYTGQQRHVCYLIPMFKETLDFHTYCGEKDTVTDIVTGRTFGNTNCGMATVANTGDDENWTGHDLAAANWYGFGRLAFDPELTSEQIAEEWIRLTFGCDRDAEKIILDILMSSRETYEKYTAPLGVGWMVNPGYHYGPNVDGYEFSEWGTYHRSDAEGMGVERGKNGTGYIGQYNEPLASMYENPDTCPDELLLFMHHVPYTHKLHSGKTVIQHIYDSHYEGVQEVERMRAEWQSLEEKIAPKIFKRTLERFDEHLRSAKEWRDAVCKYYRDKSGIPDEKGRI